MPQISDNDLLVKCIRGEKIAWDIFVERFSKLIYWSIQQALKTSALQTDKDLVSEIFQEVFQKLLEKNELSKLRDTQGLKKFLVVLSNHAAMDRIKNISRYQARHSPLILKSGVEASDFGVDCQVDEDVSNQTNQKERNQLIAQCLDELAPKETLCIEWHCFDGKTHREISEILGLSQDTVSSIIRRTKEKLKKKFLERGI